MRIILDVPFLSKEYLPGSYQFLAETIIEMARRHSNDSFIFLTHQRGKTLSNLPSNASVQYIKRGPLQWLGKKWWYSNVLPKKLKKLPSSLFIAADNLYVNNKGLPTCLFIIQLNLLLEGSKANAKPLNKLLSRSFNKATALITLSEHSRQMIQTQTSSSGKIKLLRLSLIDSFNPLTWVEKESVKVKYAGGCEYFVFAGEIGQLHNLFGLLKAFSQFKKKQQSNMQLLMAGNKTAWTAEFTEKLSTFKYRADVRVITNLSNMELNTIIAAAYAFVYPAQFDYFPVNILRAMKAGVPVIASRIPAIQEMAGAAAIYPASNDEDGFAKAMQGIYKDENLRSDIIDAARNHIREAKQYDMVEDCWNFFEAIFASKS